MFVLRTIIGETQINQEIGKSYILVERLTDYDKFSAKFQEHFSKSHVADSDDLSDFNTKNVYAFIWNDQFTVPLYSGQKYYVMTENGATFANLTFK